jgi:hypothetical protein
VGSPNARRKAAALGQCSGMTPEPGFRGCHSTGRMWKLLRVIGSGWTQPFSAAPLRRLIGGPSEARG